MEPVKVALRIRPMLESEINMGCQQCIERIAGESQIRIGTGSNFYSFNYVFDESEGQNKIYNVAIKHLTEKLFKGYNLTILAYGQTGSGKTYTMGTNYSGSGEMGVIPRTVHEIFDTIKEMDNYTFNVTVSFLELYNENFHDLLTNKSRECSIIDMREVNNGICLPGLTEIEVFDAISALEMLNKGSLGRTVGATAMNAQSSRSHAIFTLNIKVYPKDDLEGVMISNFRFVDLAGSERSKKTGTTGDRFKEGVNINKGLLVLGNVISQLGEGNHNFISYRDSKLTRLLQDSLGGNSVTLMIACVSPADYNQGETLSTLRYADRVKKIKNKPIVNQNPQTKEILRLKKENEELRLKLIHNSNCSPDSEKLEKELNEVKHEKIMLEQKIKQFSVALSQTLNSNAKMFERGVIVEEFEKSIKERLEEIHKLINTSEVCENNSLVAELVEKVKEIQNEYRIAENELRNHEAHPDTEIVDHFSPMKQEFVLSNAKIQKELLMLTQNLFWKEELMNTYSQNASNGDQIKNAENEIAVLKKQITELADEKEELLQQLTSSSSISSKIAEQRRKRLQELEAKVSALIKKINEQEKIIKNKSNCEEKINKLKNDIVEMKKMKVRLIHQLKIGNEQLQLCKASNNKEILALKNQNMKNQNEFKKREQIHTKQQCVLKRKLEAAVAANKRLMATLEKLKMTKSRKLRGPGTQVIKEKINEDLEMVESTFQAQQSLETLILDRAHFSKELTSLKVRLQNPNITNEEKEQLLQKKEQLEEEIALRSTEIADLQLKLLNICTDEPSNTDWNIIHSMGDAKFALNHFQSLLSEKIKDVVTKEHLIADLWEQHEDFEEEIGKLKKQLDEIIKESKNTNKEKEQPAKNKPKKNEWCQFEIADEESLRAFDDSLEVDCDNIENDPDWRKTPNYKKLQSVKMKRHLLNKGKCDCKSDCDKKCSCKKKKKSCDENCSRDFDGCIKKLEDEVEINETSTNKRGSSNNLDEFYVPMKKNRIYFDDP